MKIKKCPFCGSKAESFLMSAGTVVVCTNKRCFMHQGSFYQFEDEMEAIKAWNKRYRVRKG